MMVKQVQEYLFITKDWWLKLSFNYFLHFFDCERSLEFVWKFELLNVVLISGNEEIKKKVQETITLKEGF